ncbi:MAG TPA: hypothetical protein VMK31_06340, partial [Sphingomicrobium sp.]|nr:hypothetical protein [Sphingomicrobium sp.]
MKARLRIIVASSLGLLLAGAPALAQAPPPAQPDSIGNPQLRNFSLDGTVTQPATGPAEVEPSARQDFTRQQPAARSQAPQPRVEQAAPARTQSRQAESSEAQAAAAEPSPPARPEEFATETRAASEPAAQAGSPAPGWEPSAAASLAGSQTGGLLPWLLAALAFGGAAAWFFLRQRPRESYGATDTIDLFDAQPAPAPAPLRPAPAPPQPRASKAPKPLPASGGIVSTRLRPWLEIEFVPLRGVVDEQKAAIAFEISIYNSGSVPARDVLVEGALFNAGAQQDQQIQRFFDNPVAKGDRIAVIPPLKRASVETAVF